MFIETSKMAGREAMPGLSGDLFHTNSMCINMYKCVHVFVRMCVTVCQNISISSIIQKEKILFLCGW